MGFNFLTIDIIAPIGLALLAGLSYYIYTKTRVKKPQNVVKAKAVAAKLSTDKDELIKQLKALLNESSMLPPADIESQSEAQEEPATEPQFEVVPIKARVADNITRHIYNEEIPENIVRELITKHKSLGRQWDRDGEQVYGLNKMADGTYRPIPVPSELNNAPSELYEDMKQPEVAVLMDMKEEESWAGKWGQVLMWLAVIGFLLFMWSQS